MGEEGPLGVRTFQAGEHAVKLLLGDLTYFDG
jgi:hypothetical protein